MKMRSRQLLIASAIVFGAAAHAAVINTTLTVTNATGSIGVSGVSVTGPATLTGIGSGTFSATASLTAITGGGGSTVTAPFTITLSGSSLTGNVTVPASLLLGTSTTGTGSATITGGTGTFAGATGSFPSLAGSGSGSITTGSFALSFSGAGTVATGGSAGPPTPTITAVVDAAAYTAGIAQGSIFVVKGTNLSASGFSSTSFPLPTTAGGVKITFTPASGGAGTDAYLVYLYNLSGVNQLAAILPSTVPAGTYNVTVTNNGTASAAFTARVVASKPGLITANSSGTGLGVFQNFISAAELDINRFTVGTVAGFTISPARPGQTVIGWFTGLGAVPGGDNTASPGYNFPDHGVNVQVVVGGMTITPGYAGRTPGLAGTDQVNFTLPANVQTGCTVPFQLSVNGALSNAGFIAIAPDATSNACVQPGFTTAQLQNFDQGGTYLAGGFAMTQISATIPQVGTVKIDSASGAFTKYTGFDLASIPPSTGNLQGSCYVTQITGAQGQTIAVGGTNLDAGKVTLDGPSGSNITALAFTETNNTYSLQIGEEGLPAGIPGLGGNGKIVAGTYALTAAGGADVLAFKASVTLGSPLTVTGGLPNSVTRGAGLTLNWTGGNTTDIVEISGMSGTVSGSGTSSVESGAQFVCFTTAGQGTFTVPSSILTQLPAVTAAAISGGTGFGSLFIYSGVNPTSGNGLFSAPLAAGGSIDNSTFLGFVGAGNVSEAYQ
jgi:uncharacterized protein (TIGR03437 family)